VTVSCDATSVLNILWGIRYKQRCLEELSYRVWWQIITATFEKDRQRLLHGSFVITGLPDGCHTKIPNLGTVWRPLEWYILWPFEIFDGHLVLYVNWEIIGHLVYCSKEDMATLCHCFLRKHFLPLCPNSTKSKKACFRRHGVMLMQWHNTHVHTWLSSF
jgi:hypothetical protein